MKFEFPACREKRKIVVTSSKKNPLFYYFSFILLSVMQSSKKKNTNIYSSKVCFHLSFPQIQRGKEEERGGEKKKTHINNESDAQSLQISHTAFEVIFYFFIFWMFFFFFTCCFFFFGSLTSSFLEKVLRRLRRRQLEKFALILSKQKKDSFCCLCKLQSFEQKVFQ